MLLLSIVFVPAASAQTNENMGINDECDNFSIEKEYGELFLERMGYSINLTSPTPLKNLDNDIEAVAFSISNEGYIIINVNDLSVPEFSMTNKSPFIVGNKSYYYNGPLAYVEAEELKNREIKTKYIYKKEKVNKSKKLLELQEAATSAQKIQTLSSTGGSLSHSLRTWEDSSVYCGPIAAGITLIYFDDYHDDDFVDSNYENQDDLLDLITDGYIPNQGTSTLTVTNGLDDYLVDRNLDDDYSAKSSSSFSYSKIQSLINSNKPIIVDTDNHPTFGEHWIIAHGYYVLTVPYVNPQYYIIVNNGWGDNNVNVLVDNYIDDMVYIE